MHLNPQEPDLRWRRLERYLAVLGSIAMLIAVKTGTLPGKKIDFLIVRTPGVLGGRPRIRGHRIAVHRITAWWQLGLSIEEIAEIHPSLKPAEIHAALAFYHLNRAEIDGYLIEERGTLAPAAVASPRRE